MLYISWMDLLYKIRDYNQLSSLFIAREVVNIFPQYIAVQSRVSRFSWSLYSAQTLDQAICWRSKMCFQKFIIYILRYTHRKAPFIRTWVLAIQYVRKKKMIRPIKSHVGGVWVWRPNFLLFLVLVGCSGLAMRIASQKFNAKVHTVRLKENEFLP